MNMQISPLGNYSRSDSHKINVNLPEINQRDELTGHWQRGSRSKITSGRNVSTTEQEFGRNAIESTGGVESRKESWSTKAHVHNEVGEHEMTGGRKQWRSLNEEFQDKYVNRGNGHHGSKFERRPPTNVERFESDDVFDVTAQNQATIESPHITHDFERTKRKYKVQKSSRGSMDVATTPDEYEERTSRETSRGGERILHVAPGAIITTNPKKRFAKRSSKTRGRKSESKANEFVEDIFVNTMNVLNLNRRRSKSVQNLTSVSGRSEDSVNVEPSSSFARKESVRATQTSRVTGRDRSVHDRATRNEVRVGTFGYGDLQTQSMSGLSRSLDQNLCNRHLHERMISMQESQSAMSHHGNVELEVESSNESMDLQGGFDRMEQVSTLRPIPGSGQYRIKQQLCPVHQRGANIHQHFQDGYTSDGALSLAPSTEQHVRRSTNRSDSNFSSNLEIRYRHASCDDLLNVREEPKKRSNVQAPTLTKGMVTRIQHGNGFKQEPRTSGSSSNLTIYLDRPNSAMKQNMILNRGVSYNSDQNSYISSMPEDVFSPPSASTIQLQHTPLAHEQHMFLQNRAFNSPTTNSSKNYLTVPTIHINSPPCSYVTNFSNSDHERTTVYSNQPVIVAGFAGDRHTSGTSRYQGSVSTLSPTKATKTDFAMSKDQTLNLFMPANQKSELPQRREDEEITRTIIFGDEGGRDRTEVHVERIATPQVVNEATFERFSTREETVPEEEEEMELLETTVVEEKEQRISMEIREDVEFSMLRTQGAVGIDKKDGSVSVEPWWIPDIYKAVVERRKEKKTKVEQILNDGDYHKRVEQGGVHSEGSKMAGKEKESWGSVSYGGNSSRINSDSKDGAIHISKKKGSESARNRSQHLSETRDNEKYSLDIPVSYKPRKMEHQSSSSSGGGRYSSRYEPENVSFGRKEAVLLTQTSESPEDLYNGSLTFSKIESPVKINSSRNLDGNSNLTTMRSVEYSQYHRDNLDGSFDRQGSHLEASNRNRMVESLEIPVHVMHGLQGPPSWKPVRIDENHPHESERDYGRKYGSLKTNNFETMVTAL